VIDGVEPPSTKPSRSARLAAIILWLKTSVQMRHFVVLSPAMVLPHPLAALPRAWWFPALRGLRGEASATYLRFDLDEQPPIVSDDSLTWLNGEPEQAEWAIDSPDVPPQLTLTADALSAIGGDLPVPAALSLFPSQHDLQHRVRSATGCYLDLSLGDLRVPTPRPGGYLVHFLSVQQWVRHWLLYLDSDGNEGIVTTEAPIGFDLSDDPDFQDPPPDIVALD
jgi:hypothetical protein